MIKPDITPEAIDRLIESIKVSAVDNYLDAIAALRAQSARIEELEGVRLKVKQEALEVNRAFIIASQARPAQADRVIHKVELILEKSVKALRAMTDEPTT
jgi:hypothetical protein